VPLENTPDFELIFYDPNMCGLTDHRLDNPNACGLKICAPDTFKALKRQNELSFVQKEGLGETLWGVGFALQSEGVSPPKLSCNVEALFQKERIYEFLTHPSHNTRA
jgi:hypothetical protein